MSSPCWSRLAYLNAGTDGPLPAAAIRASVDELSREAEHGRARAHFERRVELNSQLRKSYATALGCEPSELALTSCTSEGIAQVIGGLELGAGDEILTSDEEHPGLLGALGGRAGRPGRDGAHGGAGRHRRCGRSGRHASGGVLARRLDERQRRAGGAGGAGRAGAARRRPGRRRDRRGCARARLRRLRGRRPEVDVRT